MTMRPFTDNRGGLNHLVDAQIGRAFPVVHKVYQHLDAIEYVAKVCEDGRARDIVLRTNHTKEWIEWQYKGEAKWTILFKFSDLLGADIADVVAAEQAIAAELAQLRQQLAADVETVTEARLGAEAARDAASESQAAAAQSVVTATQLIQNLGDAVAAAEASAVTAQAEREAAQAAQAVVANSAQEANTAAVAANAARDSAQGFAAETSAAKGATSLLQAAAEQSALAAAQSQTAAGDFADVASASATAAALSESTAASHLADLTNAVATTEAAAAASAQHLSAIESQVVVAGLLKEQTETASQAAVDAQAAAEVAANAAEQSATAAANSSAQALTRANAAGASATLAEQSSQTAQAFKAAAEASAGAAASSAVESAASAAAALASEEGAAAVVNEARDAALAHTATAKAWADKVDGEVEPGKYSARYWAEITAGAATGGVVYMGTWSAAGGVFPSNPGRGHLYKVFAAGEIAGESYSVKDMIIFNGKSWDKIDSTDEVTSVAGRMGAVLLTKADVGLENVDNTADMAKPVSAAQQVALNQKQDTLVSGASIKRLNGESLLGSGDVTISKSSLGLGNVDNTADLDKPVSTAQRVALDQKQNNLVTGANLKTVNGQDLLGAGDVAITKGDVGLANVDNTSDADKPVSTAQREALDGKEPTIAAGTAIQYWRGDKTWRDFGAGVRTAALTGLTMAASAAIAATDTVLDALAKLQAQLGDKVDKVSGKGLSTEDYTTAEKTKLAGLSATRPVSNLAVTYVNGQATAVTEDGVTKSISYDAQGRVATVSYPYAGKTRTETYTYNTNGQMTGMTTSDAL